MPIKGMNQARNNAGGYVFTLDDWAVFDRFLILGSEAGSYYVAPQKLTQSNAQTVIRLIAENGPRVVERIVEVSTSGRAPKNDPAIFALSLAASVGDEATRRLALEALPQVCRTGTHLFQFAEACDGLRGWGRGLRRAIGDWYNGKSVEDLELQLVKYQRRGGWSNRDLLRLAHPKPRTPEHGRLFKWVVNDELPEGMPRVGAMEALKAISDSETAATIIRESRLPREAVPTNRLNDAKVWEALLVEMPMTAMIRNLATMTRCGLLSRGSEATNTVVSRIVDAGRLKKARVHPIAILQALRTYANGRGLRSDAMWEPVTEIVDALNMAFYLAFLNVPPTGKRFLLGMDVSGSMSMSGIAGSSLTAAEGAAAMAMATLRTELDVTPMAFCDRFVPLAIDRSMRLDEVLRRTANMTFGSTDCSLPMQYARQMRVPVDVFVIYTDNETWAGHEHPFQALEKYRNSMGIDAKLVVVGMTATNFTIANPKDRGMLDVVGFDASVPNVMRQFVMS